MVEPSRAFGASRSSSIVAQAVRPVERSPSDPSCHPSNPSSDMRQLEGCRPSPSIHPASRERKKEGERDEPNCLSTTPARLMTRSSSSCRLSLPVKNSRSASQ